MSFLNKVARQIVDEHPDGFRDVLIVFNNRRAGLFLQREMQQLSGKPFFLPRIIGIDDLVRELGGLRIVPHEFLLFELYDIHRSRIPDCEPFEDFIALGEMMLGDFAEIDLYGADAGKLLGNLYDLKELGEWNLEGKGLTDFQRRYLDFYNSLYHYYNELRERLFSRGEAYGGMAYRNVAEHIDTLTDKVEERHLYFVGFNALSRCESTIIKCFEMNGRGTLICDGDLYYFADEMQEAGRFLRQNAQSHIIDTDFGNHFASGEKVIHIVNSPENVLQTKAAAAIITQGGAKAWGSGSAIVLADEKMLMPMLNSLPSCISAVNVSMGLPYSLTGIHNMAVKILSLYANRRNDRFHHTDICNIFSDSIISRLLHDSSAHTSVADALYASKTVYASANEVVMAAEKVREASKILFLFERSGDVPQLLSLLRQLVGVVNESNCLADTVQEQEALACLLQLLNHFDEIEERYSSIGNIDILQRIYQRLAARTSIALYGEPLEDMQMLGMLETRNLDFERLIILSVNDGTIPSGRSSNSLIPYSLKHAFGLPTHEEKDAVYAYNFFRLLQRAGEVWLIYSSDAEGMGKGEPSRYIMQLRNEMAPRLTNIKIDSLPVAVETPLCTDSNPSGAKKSGRTLQRLKEMAAYGFSPSALNRYRNCPLQFYLGDVLGVREQDELSEEVESNELGTFIHKLLCDVYSTGKRISHDILAAALEKMPETIDKLYLDEVLKGRSGEGKNRIYLEVAKMEVCNFLQKEIEKLDSGHTIQIVLTDDKPISMPLHVGGPYDDININIRGTTDRVDYYDGLLRIVDYKSGSVKEDDLSIKKEILSPRDPSDKWFQVMTYAWLYCRSSGYDGEFLSGIFPLRALNADFMAASWYDTKTMDATHIDLFEQLLRDLLSEMLNPDIDFAADPKKGACDFCPFARSCTTH